MDQNEFKNFRIGLDKTQKEMAQLLGTSLKAIHSYEQGWRTIPPAVERQMYFLVSRKQKSVNGNKPCWKIKDCPPKRKTKVIEALSELKLTPFSFEPQGSKIIYIGG